MDVRGNVIGTLALVRSCTRKFLFSRKVVVAMLITMFIIAVMGYAGTQDVDRLQLGADLLDTLILFFFMPIIAMIYGASVIRDEIEDRSITQVVVSPMERAFAYLGYYVSLVISLSLVMLVIVTAGFLVFFGQLKIDSDAIDIYRSMCALVVLGSAVYSALFLFLSVFMRRPLYIGLFYAFIWEAFIGSMPGRIREVAIKHYLRSIGSDWIAFGEISRYDASGTGYSMQVLAFVTIAFLAIGILIFRNKEFP